MTAIFDVTVPQRRTRAEPAEPGEPPEHRAEEPAEEPLSRFIRRSAGIPLGAGLDP